MDRSRSTSGHPSHGTTSPKHYKNWKMRVAGLSGRRQSGAGKLAESTGLMHAMPGVPPSQTTDGVGPVGLGWDPFPVYPSLHQKRGHVDQVGQSVQIRRINTPKNETHKRCHGIDIPDSSGASEAGSPRSQGVQHHRQLELGNLVVAWREERVDRGRHLCHEGLKLWRPWNPNQKEPTSAFSRCVLAGRHKAIVL